jgi:hypothetical protein
MQFPQISSSISLASYSIAVRVLSFGKKPRKETGRGSEEIFSLH